MGEPISNPDWRRSIETDLQPLGIAAADSLQVQRQAICQYNCGLFRLLADAEVAENDVEEIFDVDGTDDAAEVAQGETKILGAQFR
jgi:hypothetical protein